MPTRPSSRDASCSDDDEIVLTRVVPRNGRSRAYRDGQLVTAAELAELAASLVDLHGQHSHVGLLTTASQRRALDRFASVDLTDLEAARAAVRAAAAVLEGLGGDAGARERELDFLRFQLDEIDRVGLTDPGEDERLEADESLLADADAHRAAAGAADAALGTERGARDLISVALAALESRAPFRPIVERLQGVAAELDDVAHDLRTTADVHRRGSRAPGGGPGPPGGAGRPAAALHLQHPLEPGRPVRGAGRAGRPRGRPRRSRRARGGGRGGPRRSARRRGARRPRSSGNAAGASPVALAAAVQARLVELALPKAQVSITVGDDDPGDDVSFLLALNPGLPAAALAKAASGGELARTMLALRLVVGAQVPTLVFDEVDAGVGGSAARSVGRALASLAESKQVLVVTHLPQVAAFADAQVALTKHDDDATTVMRAEVLGPEARVRELARMLSGLADSDTGHDHAEELLATAAAERGR